MESFDPKVIAILTSIDASLQKIANSLITAEQTSSMRLRVEELAARAETTAANVMKAAFELRGRKFDSPEEFEAAVISQCHAR